MKHDEAFSSFEVRSPGHVHVQLEVITSSLTSSEKHCQQRGVILYVVIFLVFLPLRNASATNHDQDGFKMVLEKTTCEFVYKENHAVLFVPASSYSVEVLQNNAMNLRISSSFYCQNIKNVTANQECHWRESQFGKYLKPLLCRKLHCANISIVSIDQNLGYEISSDPNSFYARYNNSEIDLTSDVFGISERRARDYSFCMPNFFSRPVAFVNKLLQKREADRSANYVFKKFSLPVWLVLAALICALFLLVRFTRLLSPRNRRAVSGHMALALAGAVTMATFGIFTCIYAAQMRSEAMSEPFVPIRSIVALARKIERKEAVMLTYSVKSLFFEELNKTNISSLVILRRALAKHPPLVLPLEKACKRVATRTQGRGPIYILVAQETYVVGACGKYLALMEHIPLPGEPLDMQGFIISRKLSRLRETINRLSATGMVNELFHRNLRREMSVAMANRTSVTFGDWTERGDMIDLNDLQLVFILLAVGLITSGLACLAEALIRRYYRRHHHNERFLRKLYWLIA